MSVTTEMVDHCNKFNMCKGCKFNGNECVAPLSNYNDKSYKDWVDLMNNKIKELTK